LGAEAFSKPGSGGAPSVVVLIFALSGVTETPSQCNEYVIENAEPKNQQKDGDDDDDRQPERTQVVFSLALVFRN
jgi:hypothetical protein